MGIVSVAALAVGLAMDAAAVSIARRAAAGPLRLRNAVSVAVFFGGFQAGMPLLGWALGRELGRWVASWDHWIAFVLLTGVGLKMLHEARRIDPEDPRPGGDPFGLRVMFVLAVATSIDAFAAGITLPMLDAPIAVSIGMIGVTTAVLSVVGLALGAHFGARLGSRFDAFGGVVLILLGTKTLVEHFVAR
jgi:putative Mn2+ efflux pump MntP